MFYKTCTILMTVIIACRSACNTRVEKCDESISKKFLKGPRLEPTPLAFVSKHYIQNTLISLSQPMEVRSWKNLNIIHFEDPEPKKR